MNNELFTTIYNTYFKGGPDDSFISGQWIGSDKQENIIFIACTFNGVAATFHNCVFIDCHGHISEGRTSDCKFMELPLNVRLLPQRKNADGKFTN